MGVAGQLKIEATLREPGEETWVVCQQNSMLRIRRGR
jgi:hypothetical protein